MTDTPPLPASARLALALGRPAPAPMTDAERRAFDEALDRGVAEAEEFYRQPGQAVA